MGIVDSGEVKKGCLVFLQKLQISLLVVYEDVLDLLGLQLDRLIYLDGLDSKEVRGFLLLDVYYTFELLQI
jgi:hypothetical protein